MDFKKEMNKAKCACTYMTCPRRGDCYACVEHHQSRNEIPACFFNPEAEKTYDRSLANFMATTSVAVEKEE